MQIPVFYNPKQTARTKSLSPSSRKPALVVNDWLKRDLYIKVEDFSPAHPHDISLAHDPHYVAGILAGKLENGFRNKSKAIAGSLPYTVGSMVAATLRVAMLRNCGTVSAACSPTSGFHHAHYRSGGGFCTFNGLMIAAIRALKLKMAERIAILDFDYHYGDGIYSIVNDLGLHDRIRHFDAYSECSHERCADDLLSMIYPAIKRFADGGVELILYQAGADQHKDDPLGGVFTTEQMRMRDKLVFQSCKQHGVAVAWNLAGGYQTPLSKVVGLHRNTMIECIRAFGD